MPLTAEKNRIDFVFSVIPQAAGTKTCINTGSGVAETPHRFSDGLSDNNGFMDALQKQAEKLWKILNDIQTDSHAWAKAWLFWSGVVSGNHIDSSLQGFFINGTHGLGNGVAVGIDEVSGGKRIYTVGGCRVHLSIKEHGE